MNGPGHSLESIAFLDPLDEPSRRSLEQRARWVRHKQGETIIDRESESRDVYFVVDGRARVVNFSLSGREISFDDIENGGVFGELAALDGQPRSATIVALTDTLVASISPDTFVNLLRDHPDMAISLMRGLAKIVGLPLIVGPVTVREPGRIEGNSIWPLAARSRLARVVCSRANCAA